MPFGGVPAAVLVTLPSGASLPLVLTSDPARPWELHAEGQAYYVRRPWRGDSSRWEFFRTHGSQPYRFGSEQDALHYMGLLEERVSRRTRRRPADADGQANSAP